MLLNKILQGDYTVSSLYHQIKLPLDIEISIPSDDPVRLVSAFVEEMNLSDLYKTYDRIRKNQVTPRQMLKIVLLILTHFIITGVGSLLPHQSIMVAFFCNSTVLNHKNPVCISNG